MPLRSPVVACSNELHYRETLGSANVEVFLDLRAGEFLHNVPGSVGYELKGFCRVIPEDDVFLVRRHGKHRLLRHCVVNSDRQQHQYYKVPVVLECK